MWTRSPLNIIVKWSRRYYSQHLEDLIWMRNYSFVDGFFISMWDNQDFHLCETIFQQFSRDTPHEIIHEVQLNYLHLIYE